MRAAHPDLDAPWDELAADLALLAGDSTVAAQILLTAGRRDLLRGGLDRSSRPGCSAAPAGASRFPTSSAFASYAGVAPVEVASADRAPHRLPRGGDRQLNLALHIAALTQVRMRGSLGRAYYDRKIVQGKTRNEAMRCLKRRLADPVWRIMIADERERVRAAGPGGQPGATLTSSAAGSTPTASSSDKSLPGPAAPEPTTSDPAA